MQDFTAIVNEKNPADSAILKLNGSSVNIPLANRFDNGTAVYRASFDPSKFSSREGMFYGEFIVKDRAGNEARGEVSFLVNLEAPSIKDVGQKK
jgi:hypothetical protein